MKIVRPLPDKHIYIAKNFLPHEVAQKCSDFYHARAFYGSGMSHEERLALTHLPERDHTSYESEVMLIVKNAKIEMKELMKQTFPDQKLELFKPYQDVSIRTPEGGTRDGLMIPHVDGPGEIDSPDHGVKTVGALLYFNDNYDGGELTYPNLNYEYKPEAGSFVMHLGGDNDYLHGVNEVRNGWRFNLGMFGYEYYPEFKPDNQYRDQGKDRMRS